MIAGCVYLNKRSNSSTCCSTYFSSRQYLNSFGSCITTEGRELNRETFAMNLRGFTFLVKTNIQDRIGMVYNASYKYMILHTKKNDFRYNELIELDESMVSPRQSERQGIAFSVSHTSVFNYNALLSDSKYILPGSSAMIGLSVSRVHTDFCILLLLIIS